MADERPRAKGNRKIVVPLNCGLHVFFTNKNDTSSAREIAVGMSGMLFAGPSNTASGVHPRCSDDVDFLSMGLLSWRKFPHQSILDRLGKTTRQQRDYVLYVRFEPTARRQHIVPESSLRGVAYFVQSQGRAIPPQSRREHEGSSEPLDGWRSRPSLHELLACVVRTIHQQPSSESKTPGPVAKPRSRHGR